MTATTTPLRSLTAIQGELEAAAMRLDCIAATIARHEQRARSMEIALRTLVNACDAQPFYAQPHRALIDARAELDA